MQTTITAEWNPAFSSLYKANAQLVAQEITSIGDSVTAAQIVEKARDNSTELHKCFEWDNTVAAEKYRLQQAGQVVRHLVIRETIVEDRPPVRFMFTPKRGTGYQHTKLILQNKDSYQTLLESALRDFEALKRKYHTLIELEQIFDAIDELVYK